MKRLNDAELLNRFRERMSAIEPLLPQPSSRPWLAARSDARRRVAQPIGLLAAVVVAAVLGVMVLAWPDASRPAGPATSLTDTSPSADARHVRLVQVGTVSLEPDMRTLLIEFTGGPSYSWDNPCSFDYAATAQIVEDHVELAVSELKRPTRPHLPLEACPLAGYGHRLEVVLAQPFLGYRIEDRAGGVHFVRRPDGLAELELPSGWVLESEANAPGTANGRWKRTYKRERTTGAGVGGRLHIYQAFDGPAGVAGAIEQPPVTVRGAAADLYLWPEVGEIVLVWRLGGDGLALVANERNFTVEELVALAETAHLPESPSATPTTDPSTPPTPAPTSSPTYSASLSFDPGPSPSRFIDVDAREFVGPIAATVRSSAVWTGSEVVYWGGWYGAPDFQPGSTWTAEGAAYDPRADSWRVLPTAPLSARERAFAGWTGDEVLIWGGSGPEGFTPDGAAYHLQANTWRVLSPAPPAFVADLGWLEEQGGPEGPAAIWTGEHWVIGFKTYGDDESDLIRLAAYAPATDTWQELPTVRALRGGGLELAWTGSELVMTSLEDAWRIRIADESWRPVSRGPWQLPLSSPVWIGDRLLAVVSKWGPDATPWSFLATWNPAADTWQPLAQPPRSAHGQILLRDDLAIVLGSGLAYDLTAGVWVDLPLEVSRNDAVVTWTGIQLVVWAGWDCDMCGSGVFQSGLVLTPGP